MNADVAMTYRSILGIEAPRAVRRARYSPSAAVWVAGVRAPSSSPLALAIASVRLPPVEASVAAVHCWVISQTGFCLGQGFGRHAGRELLTLRRDIDPAFDRFYHLGHPGAQSFPALVNSAFFAAAALAISAPWR